MNYIEKAISVLKMENELMQFDPNTGENYPIELQNQDNQDLYKANLIAISALEKQIAKEVDYTELNYSNLPVAKCPSCNSKIINDNRLLSSANYCPDCSQKLDWEV